MLLCGIDVLRGRDYADLRGKRVGLLSHAGAVSADLRSTYRLLYEAEEVHLVAVFSPEHGFFGMAREGESVPSAVDARTGVPIYSLYGQHYRPPMESLVNLDALVIDLQDIGARYYTYIWTMSYVLEACGQIGLPVIVLDRPNPIGDALEGPLLHRDLASLVGRFAIPARHGLTVGELAQLFVGEFIKPAPPLEVIRCVGWQRGQWLDAVSGVFIPPSPAMPSLDAASHYIGSCLIEATNLSEGRGTALPFQITGAPYLDAEQLADGLNGRGQAGVFWRAYYFRPGYAKYADAVCGGVMAHVVDRGVYQPLTVWLDAIGYVIERHADQFQWVSKQHFDRLMGVPGVRAALEKGQSAGEIAAGWLEGLAGFESLRAGYRLY